LARLRPGGHVGWVLVVTIALSCLGAGAVRANFSGFTPESPSGALSSAANGTETPIPEVNATPVPDGALDLDGRLDEPAWQNAPGANGFRMWDPDRGAPASEPTVFKVLYDEGAVYFGVACYETDPSRIASCLSRRDQFNNSDVVSINIDPYFDRTTGYSFQVNPLGVQMDAFLFNDVDQDPDWDAVWQAETYRDDDGWYVEMRIPFSSIRYKPSASMTWGLQVSRTLQQRGEQTSWVIWDRETRGYVSRFGELHGLENVSAPRQLELLPYFVERAENGPGRSGLLSTQILGGDIKYGVTADLTLNATIQPDFGQVEADPAEVNLSPFETQFEEKRPFFVEGSRYFQHPDFNLFYSRRIGTGNAYSRIRFAGKLTGRTGGGYSIAALFATTDVTEPGQAHNLFKSGSQKSHYAVARVGKDLSEGAFRFNLMGTAAIHTADPAVYGITASREAYTGGLDFDLNFKNREFNIQGSMVGSFIDPEVVGTVPVERSYGTGGALDIRRRGGTLQGGIYGRWESDDLQLNDLGFLSAPDEINTGFWLTRILSSDGTDGFINRGEMNLNFWNVWLYGGRTGHDAATGDVVWSYGPGHPQWTGGNVNGWAQFKSYWEGWFGIEFQKEGTQRYETRGGPLISEPRTYGFWLGSNTDSRKRFVPWIEGNYYWDRARNYSANLSVGTRWAQTSAVNHQLSVGWHRRIDDTQYLETVNLAERPGGRGIGGRSYVFGAIDQTTLDLTLRSSLLFTRNQSLELYLQPFVSEAAFTNGRELAAPDTYDLIPYNEPGWQVGANDFRYTSLNVNLVYRWEYRPGSTLFLVWTHARETRIIRGQTRSGAYEGGLDPGALFDNQPENVFLIKATYWIPL